MRFVYPWLLLLHSLIPVVGVVWLWLHRRAKQRLSMLIAEALQDKLVPQQQHTLFYVQFVLVISGLVLLVFAAARPQWGTRDERVMTRGCNLVIALDVSRSMLATDVHPNRLERARTDIMDLIDELEGDRAALLAFRQKGSLICPLTTDYAFLRQALDGVSPESAPRGATNLGDAIRKSLEALDPAQDEYNAILFISDGEDLSGGALAAAQEAGKRNIPIFTVGIGDTAGATIPDPDGKGMQKFKGEVVTTRLTAETLTAIAQASKGRYIPLGTAGTAHTTLGAIYRQHLRQIAAREQEEMLQNRYQERYQLFLVPAILFLLLAAGCSRGRLRGKWRLQPRQTAVVTLLIALLTLFNVQGTTVTPAPDPLSAVESETEMSTSTDTEPASTNQPPLVVVAPGRAGAREAQKLLRKGQYQQAAEAFASAARGADHAEAEEYHYNAGFAYFKAGAIEQAADVLRPLLGSRRLGVRAGELYGALQMELAKSGATNAPATQVKALENAALGFQRALRAEPQDQRRDRNLRRAIAPLDEARESAHIASVLEKYGQLPPDQLMDNMLSAQRSIMTAAQGVYTNEAVQMIVGAEQLAKQQEEQADLWIPLKQHIMQSVTNQQQQAQIVQQVELTRDSMQGCVQAFQDLLPEAVTESGQLEQVVYRFWQGTAMPPGLNSEAILCQSNAIASLNLPYYQERDTQIESLHLTELFADRFIEWSQAYLAQAQSDTNMPPFTVEDQEKIKELTAEVITLQKKIMTDQLPLDQKRKLQESALEKLLEIQQLLPKQSGQSSSESQSPQPQQDQQEEQSSEQEEQEQAEDEEKEQTEQPEKEEKKEPPPDVKEVLRRALEREKEHEQDKKARMRSMPLAPSEQDW